MPVSGEKFKNNTDVMVWRDIGAPAGALHCVKMKALMSRMILYYFKI